MRTRVPKSNQILPREYPLFQYSGVTFQKKTQWRGVGVRSELIHRSSRSGNALVLFTRIPEMGKGFDKLSGQRVNLQFNFRIKLQDLRKRLKENIQYLNRKGTKRGRVTA